MPALARQTLPDHDDYRPVATRPVNRHPSKSSTRTGTRHATRIKRASTQAAPDSREVRELLSHFGHGEASLQAKARDEMQVRRDVRRRARLRHRPFRMTVAATLLGAAPLALLASLLWLRSSALAMSRQDSKLQNQINAARFELQNTRKQIAALNASPHLDEWAKERKWRRATQKDFDQVPAPVVAENTEE